MTDHGNLTTSSEKVVVNSSESLLKNEDMSRHANINLHDHLNPHGATLVLHDIKLATPPLFQASHVFQSRLLMDDDNVRHEIYIPNEDGVVWNRGAGAVSYKMGQIWLKTVAPSTQEGCSAITDACHGPKKDYYIGLIRNLASGVEFEDIKVLPNGDCSINLDLRHSMSPSKENMHYFRENPNDSTLFEIALTKGVIEPQGKSAHRLCSYINPAHQNLPFLDKAPCVSKYLKPGEIIDIKPGLVSYYTPKAHFDETCTGLYCNYDLYGEYFVEGSKDVG